MLHLGTINQILPVIWSLKTLQDKFYTCWSLSPMSSSDLIGLGKSQWGFLNCFPGAFNFAAKVESSWQEECFSLEWEDFRENKV